MTKTISTPKLHTLRKSAAGFLLIDVRPRECFDQDHIPGACNVPFASADLAAAVAGKASGCRSRKVVLYGAGPGCDAAGEAVQKLVTGGFTNVIEYDGGLAAWNESKRARVARAGRKA